ncbi:MAG: hypothetical protein Q9172_006130 [Xanthocarpia lactea]
MKYSLVGAAIIAGTVMTAAAPLHEKGPLGPRSEFYAGVSQICSEGQSSVHCCEANGNKADDKKEVYYSGGSNRVKCRELGGKDSKKKKPTKAIHKRVGRVASRTIAGDKIDKDGDKDGDSDSDDDDSDDDDKKDDDDKDDDDKDDDKKDDDKNDDHKKDDDKKDDDKKDDHKKDDDKNNNKKNDDKNDHKKDNDKKDDDNKSDGDDNSDDDDGHY